MLTNQLLKISNHKIDLVLQDRCTSTWLRTSLEMALKRDPLDASNDAELLSALLSEHRDAILYASQSCNTTSLP